MTESASADVRLIPIDQSNWRRCLAVRVRDDQLRFVADHQPVVLVILAKSYVGLDDRTWEPLAIEREGEIVGVVGLSHSPTDTHMVNLAIDHGAQRAGIGTAAVGASIARCRSRGSQRLLLTVNADNTAAQSLYRNAGFSPTGRLIDDDPEWTLDLTR